MAALPAESSSSRSSTRDRLLAAAVEVFVDQGFEGARLQDIARAAGLTTGAIYANFRGKGDLLFDAMGARADAEMDGILSEAHGREIRELLELLGDMLVRPRQQPPLLIDAVAAARRDAELASALRRRLGEREAAIAELVGRAKEEGSIDPAIETDVLTRFCVTLAMGAVVMRTLRAEPPDGDAWHQLIARLLDALAEEAK